MLRVNDLGNIIVPEKDEGGALLEGVYLTKQELFWARAAVRRTLIAEAEVMDKAAATQHSVPEVVEQWKANAIVLRALVGKIEGIAL